MTAITVGRSRSIFPAGYSAPYRQRKHGLTFGIRTTGVRQNVSRPIHVLSADTYYLNRLNDWGLCFRKCKVCGHIFLAKSQRYELCNDKCRKKQALQNKREFDERARENNYDLLYKNECQNWRNKINKAKRTAGFPADRLEEMLTAFEAFKKEALQRKRAVKERTASPKEFTDWLYQQSSIIVELAEKSS